MCVVTAATQLQHLTSSAFYTNPELSQGCLPSATHMCVLTAATQLFQTLNITFLLHKSRAEPGFPAFCNKHVCVCFTAANQLFKKTEYQAPLLPETHMCVLTDSAFSQKLDIKFLLHKGVCVFFNPTFVFSQQQLSYTT